MLERSLVERLASWKAGSPSAPSAEEAKQANSYADLIVSGVKHRRKDVFAAESSYWQCKPSSCLCKLQHGRSE